MLVTSGASGYTLVVTGIGQTIEAARNAANALADKVRVTNARYRQDIGTRLIEGEFAKIEALELLALELSRMPVLLSPAHTWAFRITSSAGDYSAYRAGLVSGRSNQANVIAIPATAAKVINANE